MQDVFWVPRLSTLDDRLREFQFKLLHSILCCKDKLFLVLVFHYPIYGLFIGKRLNPNPYSRMNCQAVNSIWNEVGEELLLMQLKSLEWKHILIGIDGKSEKVVFLIT